MFAERRDIIVPHHFGHFLHRILFRFQQHSGTTHTYTSDQFYNGIVGTLLHFSVESGLAHIHFRCQFLHTEVRLANILFYNFDNGCDKRIFRLHFLTRLFLLVHGNRICSRQLEQFRIHLLQCLATVNQITDFRFQNARSKRFQHIIIRTQL